MFGCATNWPRILAATHTSDRLFVGNHNRLPTILSYFRVSDVAKSSEFISKSRSGLSILLTDFALHILWFSSSFVIKASWLKILSFLLPKEILFVENVMVYPNLSAWCVVLKLVWTLLMSYWYLASLEISSTLQITLIVSSLLILDVLLGSVIPTVLKFSEIDSRQFFAASFNSKSFFCSIITFLLLYLSNY